MVDFYASDLRQGFRKQSELGKGAVGKTRLTKEEKRAATAAQDSKKCEKFRGEESDKEREENKEGRREGQSCQKEGIRSRQMQGSCGLEKKDANPWQRQKK